MRFAHEPPDDDLLFDPPAPAEEPADRWEDPIVEPSLLADFQPDTARAAAAVAAPPSAPSASADDGDSAYLFSALGAPPDGVDEDRP